MAEKRCQHKWKRVRLSDQLSADDGSAWNVTTGWWECKKCGEKSQSRTSYNTFNPSNN